MTSSYELPAYSSSLASRREFEGSLLEAAASWDVDLQTVFLSGSMSLVGAGTHPRLGAVVVKVGLSRMLSPESIWLKNVGSDVAPRLYDSDLRDAVGSLLCEQITPATLATSRSDFAISREVFRLLRSVSEIEQHSPLPDAARYIEKRTRRELNGPAPSSTFILDKERWCIHLADLRIAAQEASVGTTFVHGDLLPKNVISSSGGLRIIDPFGLRGSKEMDLASWITSIETPGSISGLTRHLRIDRSIDMDKLETLTTWFALVRGAQVRPQQAELLSYLQYRLVWK